MTNNNGGATQEEFNKISTMAKEIGSQFNGLNYFIGLNVCSNILCNMIINKSNDEMQMYRLASQISKGMIEALNYNVANGCFDKKKKMKKEMNND